MSLEQALAANTAALERLCALLANPPVVVQGDAPVALETLPGVPDTKAAKPAKAAKPIKVEAPKPAEPEAPKVARKDVGDALMALAESKGRDAARALLARFDVKVLADAKPEQYPDIKAAAEKEMA